MNAAANPHFRIYPGVLLCASGATWLLLTLWQTQDQAGVRALFHLLLLGMPLVGWMITPWLFCADFKRGSTEAAHFIMLPLPLFLLCFLLSGGAALPIVLLLVSTLLAMLLFGVACLAIVHNLQAKQWQIPLLTLLQWLPPVAFVTQLANISTWLTNWT